jgi:hypothetical protein
MLRAAAGRGHAEFDVVAAALDVVAPIPHDKTREIYYRVTGRPIEAEPAPRFGRAPLQGRRDDRWDVSQGGDQVGVIAWRGLSLQSSRFDGSIDAGAALGYVEWTFEVKNEAPIQREARVELALPPGGVVSRVTLWIDGVEREAAFAGRDATRRAYERVVRARRDPILVTTSAPDRVLVQCFPGAAEWRRHEGARRHHRAVAPGARPGGHARAALPHAAQLRDPVGLQARRLDRQPAHFVTPQPPLVRDSVTDAEEVRGDLPESSTGSPLAAVTVERPARATVAWHPSGRARTSGR